MSWWPRGEDGEETVYQDTDSDVAEQRESGRVKVKWTQEEDENLKTLVQNFGQNDWKTIASFLPSRTEHQCQHRWFKVLNPDLIKGPWTKEEDEKVIDLVKKYGTKQWAMVAKHLKGRLGKQCRERWHNHLNPEVKKSSWTAEEDRIIYQAHRILGNRWAEIAKLLPGRTDNAVKNHWNSTIKRKVEMGFYAGDQDKAVTVVPQLEQGEVVAACPGKDKEVEFQCDVVMDVDPEPVSAEQDPAPVPKGPPSGEAPCSKSPPLPQLTGALTPKSEADAAGDPCPSRWVVDSAGFLSPTPLPAFKEALELIEGPACKKRSSGESCLPDSLKPFFKDLRYHEGGISTMTCKLCHFQVHSKPGTTSNFLRHIKDLEGWCDLATFDLSEDSQGSEVLQFRLEGSALQELSRGSRGELIPISPGGATPPSILTRRARRRPPAQSPGSSLIELNDSMTPKSTPVKILPFSPSQFLNMWTKQDTLDLENPSLTSTPVCSQKAIVSTPLHRDKTPLNQKDGSVFITPNHKADLSSTPRTPTPFRTALEKYGPLRPLPPTPSLEEDLKEVLRSEAGIELTAEDKTPQEQRRKQGHRPPMKKVRKSLALDVMDKESSTARPHPHRAHPRPSPEAENLQSVSLSSSSASVKKEDSVLDQGFIVAPGDVTPDPSPAPPTPMSQAWEAVVCGRTKDQLIMTEKARRYLRALNPNPPNRALILS